MIAIVYQALCKSDLDDFDDCTEDETSPELAEDEEWLHKEKIEKKREYHPYDKEYMAALKKAREKEVKMQAIMNELLTYAGFMFVLFILSYQNRDPNSFNLKNQLIESIIMKHDFLKVTSIGHGQP